MGGVAGVRDFGAGVVAEGVVGVARRERVVGGGGMGAVSSGRGGVGVGGGGRGTGGEKVDEGGRGGGGKVVGHGVGV